MPRTITNTLCLYADQYERWILATPWPTVMLVQVRAEFSNLYSLYFRNSKP